MEVDQRALERITVLEHRLALADAELLASEAEAEALRWREQQILTLLIDAQRQRQAAEYWLESNRTSLSWQITKPLRAVKRLALDARGNSLQ